MAFKVLFMETKDYLKDIQDIRNMMSQSTQFLSLSGLSGVLAGIYSLTAAYMASRILPQPQQQYFGTNAYKYDTNEIVNNLIYIAVGVILLSIVTGVVMSSIKAKKLGSTLWNATSKRLIVNFSIPLITGGLFIFQLIQKEYYGLIAPSTLLFYGLACVNASKHTLRDVFYLGITLIILGLLSTCFLGYGLEFWALGFGVCHILYGSAMYFKYDRK